jgi:hypothetical protein
MPEVETTPDQQLLESQPVVGEDGEPSPKGYGSFHKHMKFPTPDELDAKLPPKIRHICNHWIVASYQFDEMENAGAALMCARVLRAFLIFFIVTSTFGLIVGFVLKASLAAPMESEQYSGLAPPSVVICASPWGSEFTSFKFETAQKGTIPGTHFEDLGSSNYSFHSFVPEQSEESHTWLSGCKVVEVKDVIFHPHGQIARYSYFDTMKVSFAATSQDGFFNYGFCNGDNKQPQRWQYGTLGKVITGEVQYDQVNVGASDVSEGDPRSILSFKTTGEASIGSSTQIEYYYGYFMVRVLSAQGAGITLFGMVAFVLLVAAAVNNCGLFELFFVEFVPDDEPYPSMVPNLLCQAICGKWFSFCRVRKKSPEPSEDPQEDAEAGKEEEQEAAPLSAPKQEEVAAPAEVAKVGEPAAAEAAAKA